MWQRSLAPVERRSSTSATICAKGREPFADIMKALHETPRDHALVLLATFRPEPLIALLGDQGFASVAEELPGGEWRVTFRRDEDGA